jgi:ABC-type branched-subunit amino acid transport system substrate-binding protein
MKKYLHVATAAIALVALAAGANAQTKPPIKIGMLMTLSGPGAAANLPTRLGIDMALQEFNAAGGIEGRQIVLVQGDDQANPTTGVDEAKRLVYQEKIEALVGPVASAVTVAILPTLNEAKIANFTQSGSALLTPENGPYQFAVIGSAAFSGAGLADYAHQVGAKKVALIRDDSAAALSGGQEIEARLKGYGITLTGTQQYKFHPTDTTPQLLSLRGGNPEYLLIYSASQDDVGTVQKNIGEIGWNIKEIGSLAAGLAPDLVMQKAGLDAYKNLLGQVVRTITYCPKENDPGAANMVAFIHRAIPYEKAHRNGPAITDFYSMANGYDLLSAIKQAIEANDGKTDGPTIAKRVIDHPDQLHLLSIAQSKATNQTHFMFDPGNFVMVEHPEQRNENFMYKRAGC